MEREAKDDGFSPERTSNKPLARRIPSRTSASQRVGEVVGGDSGRGKLHYAKTAVWYQGAYIENGR